MSKSFFSAAMGILLSFSIFADYIEHSTCIISVEKISKEERQGRTKHELAEDLQQKNYFTTLETETCYAGLEVIYKDGLYNLYDRVACGNVNCQGACLYFKLWSDKQLEDLPGCLENNERRNKPGKLVKE